MRFNIKGFCFILNTIIHSRDRPDDKTKFLFRVIRMIIIYYLLEHHNSVVFINSDTQNIDNLRPLMFKSTYRITEVKI